MIIFAIYIINQAKLLSSETNHFVQMKYFSSLLLFIAVFLLASCNNDIFLDGGDIAENMHVDISGEGSEEVIGIVTHELERISLEATEFLNGSCVYYDTEGKECDSYVPASRLGRIVCDSSNMYFELVKNGNTIVLRSHNNNLTPRHWTVRLYYSYGIRVIDIEVSPGQALELIRIEYDDILAINENAGTKSESVVVNNNSPVAQVLRVTPYLNQATIDVSLPGGESWVGDRTFTMPLPVYTPAGWNIAQVDGIRPGFPMIDTRTEYISEFVNVDIPAYSKVRVVCKVSFSRALGQGMMIFKNVVTNREVAVQYRCISRYPVSYKIEVEHVE